MPFGLVAEDIFWRHAVFSQKWPKRERFFKRSPFHTRLAKNANGIIFTQIKEENQRRQVEFPRKNGSAATKMCHQNLPKYTWNEICSWGWHVEFYLVPCHASGLGSGLLDLDPGFTTQTRRAKGHSGVKSCLCLRCIFLCTFLEVLPLWSAPY